MLAFATFCAPLLQPRPPEPAPELAPEPPPPPAPEAAPEPPSEVAPEPPPELALEPAVVPAPICSDVFTMTEDP